MKNAPLKGDLINTVRKDIEEMNICFSDEEISCMSKCDIKLIVNNNIKEGHFKVKKYCAHSYGCFTRLPCIWKALQHSEQPLV